MIASILGVLWSAARALLTAIARTVTSLLLQLALALVFVGVTHVIMIRVLECVCPHTCQRRLVLLDEEEEAAATAALTDPAWRAALAAATASAEDPNNLDKRLLAEALVARHGAAHRVRHVRAPAE